MHHKPTKRAPRQPRVPRTCQHCGAAFTADVTQVRKGWGRFCSYDCRYASLGPIVWRFWLRVNKAGPIPAHAPHLGPCWLWTGPVSGPMRYGVLSVERRNVYTHRYMYELACGPVPEGLFVLHRCDTPRCVRPDHLWLGTHTDNMRDSYVKGRRTLPSTKGRPMPPDKIVRGDAHWTRQKPERVARGEGVARATLSTEQVRTIRQRYAAGGVSQTQLAQKYAVSQHAISAIILHRTWKHIT